MIPSLVDKKCYLRRPPGAPAWSPQTPAAACTRLSPCPGQSWCPSGSGTGPAASATPPAASLSQHLWLQAEELKLQTRMDCIVRGHLGAVRECVVIKSLYHLRQLLLEAEVDGL